VAIGASVGQGGTNDLADVLVVQHLLNAWLERAGEAPLSTDGDCGPRTVAAIRLFQARVLHSPQPDGRVDPGGRTWDALTSLAAPPPLSGADWWHANQARFPSSNDVADLASPFREQVQAFLKALSAAGAQVTIAATRRNAVRAELMRDSWQVAQGSLAPAAVPPIPGVAIRWDHGDPASSRAAAQDMVDLFDIAYEPSLTSRHIQGRAIDMTIRWTGTLAIKDKTGKLHKLATPRTGEDNAQLHAIGASYGVKKLLSDPPHWSDDGR
jgi:peptidoglycan hydrolase-like protein with peptidoglycan-binding domain